MQQTGKRYKHSLRGVSALVSVVLNSTILTHYVLQLTRSYFRQESRAVAREPRDAADVVFGLKFANNIHYKFKSSQASKARLQSSKRTGAKQNLTQKWPF